MPQVYIVNVAVDGLVVCASLEHRFINRLVVEIDIVTT